MVLSILPANDEYIKGADVSFFLPKLTIVICSISPGHLISHLLSVSCGCPMPALAKCFWGFPMYHTLFFYKGQTSVIRTELVTTVLRHEAIIHLIGNLS